MSPNEPLDLASRGLVLGCERSGTPNLHLLSPNEALDLASRSLVLGGEGRDAKSRHLLSHKKTLDLPSRGLVLAGGAGRKIYALEPQRDARFGVPRAGPGGTSR